MDQLCGNKEHEYDVSQESLASFDLAVIYRGSRGEGRSLRHTPLPLIALLPISCKIARLCCPSFGAGVLIELGVASNRGTTWCMGISPIWSSG